jgi:hypothetical protein
MENGSTIKEMESVVNNGQMEHTTKVIGRKTWLMVTVFSDIPMEISTKEM